MNLTKLNQMKNSFYKLMCVTFLIAGGCTSGQNGPVDSHPGSGSIKKDSKPDNDTAKKDSTQNKGGSQNKDSGQKQQKSK